MRILQAHKYFYNRAGAEAVFLNTINGLRERGHDVSEISVVHKNNLNSEFSNYFINTEPELTADKISLATSAKLFKHFISSKEVANKLRALVMANEPQVAHLHNVIHQMSASIFKTLKKLNVPIVLTVHDVQPMCPNHRMVVNHQLCEKCWQHKYYNCIRYKCIDESRAKSTAGALEAYYYYLRGIWHMVDVFVCSSQFMKDKLIEWGFDKKKIVVIRNFYRAPSERPLLGQKIVYLNRLHEEKGIRVFLEATRNLRDYEIIVAGEGPDDKWVEQQIQQYSLTHVRKVGRVEGEEWQKVMQQAKVVVVPSLFYENCSMSVLESQAHGRIVVAADRGGNSELIATGETGFLAEPGVADSFVTFIREAINLDEISSDMLINNARRQVMDQHNVDGYFGKLEKLYEKLV